MSSERSVESHSNRAKPGDVAYENVAIAKYSYATFTYKNSSGFQSTYLSIYYYTLFKDTNFKFSTKTAIIFIPCW